jgi:hypothetical protein
VSSTPHPALPLIREALATTPRAEDTPVDVHLQHQADAVLAILLEHGHVTPYDQHASMVDVAKWLADAARHPRFSGIENGHMQLLESTQMIDMAHAKACRQPGAQVPSLNQARDVLLAYLAEHPPADDA